MHTTGGDVVADVLINCAGLHADRVARLAGVDPPARIVPFRGEYFELTPRAARRLVRGLIYPVPDPQFPFLGVHLTRMIDGTVHAGPNAVLALAREGYRWSNVNPRDIADFATYAGLWRLARKHFRYGLTEVRRSLSRRLFAESLARLVPAVTAPPTSSRPTPACAPRRSPATASLVDDFLIVARDRQVHVLNAPSPAATSSLEIAKHIVAQLPAWAVIDHRGPPGLAPRRLGASRVRHRYAVNAGHRAVKPARVVVIDKVRRTAGQPDFRPVRRSRMFSGGALLC